VTAETAVAVPTLVVLLVAALTAVTALTAQMRCVDAARETVRAAARGDDAAVTLGLRIAPKGATVVLGGDAQAVRAVVTAPVRPLGRWLRVPTVTATATAAREHDGRPGEMEGRP
jgi:hypothetical protein